MYTVKKNYRIPGFVLTNPSWDWDWVKLFPARESLVSDIPAGDGNTAKLFFTGYPLIIAPLISRSKLNLQRQYRDESIQSWFMISLSANLSEMMPPPSPPISSSYARQNVEPGLHSTFFPG